MRRVCKSSIFEFKYEFYVYAIEERYNRVDHIQPRRSKEEIEYCEL